MPPKAKVTREMIVDSAFEILRSEGEQAVNARTVSQALNCSTQPVMYHFKTIGALKRALYEKADAYHTACITQIHGAQPMRDIGLNYIRFGVRERNVFRFLFQSNEFSGTSLTELIHVEALKPVLALLCRETGLSEEQAETAFRALFLAVHGYASMFANNEMTYNEPAVLSDLRLVFDGTVLALKGEG